MTLFFYLIFEPFNMMIKKSSSSERLWKERVKERQREEEGGGRGRKKGKRKGGRLKEELQKSR